MFRALAALVVALALTAAGAIGAQPPGPDNPSAADAERMQGVWEMAEYVVNGVAAPENMTRPWLLVVEGDVYNPGSGETSVEYRFRLDPNLLPKSIDLAPLLPGSKGKYYRGVYKLDGETLTICRPLDIDDERPAGFTARDGSNLTRVVWKRRKP
jgi:uncharacterized protein (TIGR03067 family)